MSNETDKARAESVMSAIDEQSPEVRAIIHDYGLALVNWLMQAGITEPDALRRACERFRGEKVKAQGV